MPDQSPQNQVSNSANRSWNLKIASKEDVEPVLAKLADKMTEQARSNFRIKLQKYVRKPDRDLILAEKNDRILGLACVIMQMDPPPNFIYERVDQLKEYAFNTQLQVHPDHRKQGIGEGLQHQSLLWSKERGRVGHWLITHTMADWYRRHFGYEEIGRVHMKGVEKVAMILNFK